MTWRLNWEHTTLFTEDARGECAYDVAEISRDAAESTMTGLARRYWPPADGGMRIYTVAIGVMSSVPAVVRPRGCR